MEAHPHSEMNSDSNPFSGWVHTNSSFDDVGIHGGRIWVDVEVPKLRAEPPQFRMRIQGRTCGFIRDETVHIGPPPHSLSFKIFEHLCQVGGLRNEVWVDLVDSTCSFTDGIVKNSFAVGTLRYDEGEHRWQWWKPSLRQAPAIAGPVSGNPEVVEET